jgi:hypothetical protein
MLASLKAEPGSSFADGLSGALAIQMGIIAQPVHMILARRLRRASSACDLCERPDYSAVRYARSM